MTDKKTLLGQIEFLRERNARLYDETKSLKHQNHVLLQNAANLNQMIANRDAQIADLLAEIAAKEEEIRKQSQKLEVLMEYNKRLNEKANLVRDLPSNVR